LTPAWAEKMEARNAEEHTPVVCCVQVLSHILLRSMSALVKSTLAVVSALWSRGQMRKRAWGMGGVRGVTK